MFFVIIHAIMYRCPCPLLYSGGKKMADMVHHMIIF